MGGGLSVEKLDGQVDAWLQEAANDTLRDPTRVAALRHVQRAATLPEHCRQVQTRLPLPRPAPRTPWHAQPCLPLNWGFSRAAFVAWMVFAKGGFDKFFFALSIVLPRNPLSYASGQFFGEYLSCVSFARVYVCRHWRRATSQVETTPGPSRPTWIVCWPSSEPDIHFVWHTKVGTLWFAAGTNHLSALQQKKSLLFKI